MLVVFRVRSLFALVLWAISCGCAPTPDSYPIPEQHGPVAAPEPVVEHGFVSVSDVRAEAAFLKDIGGLEGDGWRWTGQNPELRFHLVNVSQRKVLVDFTIHDSILKDTGPLRMNFYVNGHLLDRVTYETAGEKTFEKMVPQDWLKAQKDNNLSLHIENPWIAPNDGAKLGILLRRAGFVE